MPDKRRNKASATTSYVTLKASAVMTSVLKYFNETKLPKVPRHDAPESVFEQPVANSFHALQGEEIRNMQN